MGIRNMDNDYNFLIWTFDTDASDWVAPVKLAGENNVVLVNDIYCCSVKSWETKDVSLCMMTDTKQAIADKATGTGTEILAGELVYLISATGFVTNVAAGNVLIGHCIRDAADSDATVDIDYDGRIWNL